MSTVYVMNNFGNNVKKAGKFGDILEISAEPLNAYSIDRLAWTLAPSLAKFTPDDYLLLTGPGSAYIVAGLILFSRPDIQELKCLRFDSMMQQYVKLVIPRREVEAIESDKPAGRIFALNYSGHIIAPALEFSDLPRDQKLVILTKGNVDQYDVEGMTQLVCYGYPNSSGLNEYQKGDMLLLSGPGMLHMIAAAAIVSMGKDVSLLLYSPRSQNYLLRPIAVKNLIETAILSAEHAA